MLRVPSTFSHGWTDLPGPLAFPELPRARPARARGRVWTWRMWGGASRCVPDSGQTLEIPPGGKVMRKSFPTPLASSSISKTPSPGGQKVSHSVSPYVAHNSDPSGLQPGGKTGGGWPGQRGPSENHPAPQPLLTGRSRSPLGLAFPIRSLGRSRPAPDTPGPVL